MMTITEAFNSASWPEDYFRRAVAMEAKEYWNEATAPGKGVILVTAHFGNWELMPPGFLNGTGVAAGIIMRAMRAPGVTELVRAMRGRRGNPIYLSSEPAIGLMRQLKRGGVISLLADQDTLRLRGTHVDFFDRPALTPVAPAFLARKTGASMLPIFIHRCEDNPKRHVMRVHPPIFSDSESDEDGDIRRMLQEYTARLEGEVRERPGHWAWMHERWKHAPEAHEQKTNVTPAGSQRS